MTDMTPWGPALEQKEDCVRGKGSTRTQRNQLRSEASPPRHAIRVKWPWHKGWLGGVTVERTNDSFQLSRTQVKSFIKSQRQLGVEVIEVTS
jgi:hypothetical protein